MAKIALIVGTTLGGTEYVADDMAAQLVELGHQAEVYMQAELMKLSAESLWLIVSSTHGAGELPDNIKPFYEQLMASDRDLRGLKFALCAIGDSNYDTFCHGPEKIIDQLKRLGGDPFVDKIQIDIQSTPVPEEPALAWLAQWQHLLN
ncbi:FMN-binding protein MioC [Shewanella sp. SR44-3]|uniref:FMN-binding protein MioC n=1 Tax=unclassified Shewanella TaxID=196818 RepID=UPI0015FC9C9B|nr:FMN-binding protein MioC [Shewanella sp. SR44-3]MBB1269772.1 FMN-binding protein MioC [Shewanella sp. SR44-3]